jgi:hypothetical protein
LTSGALPAKMAAITFAATLAFASFAKDVSNFQKLLQNSHVPFAISMVTRAKKHGLHKK